MQCSAPAPPSGRAPVVPAICSWERNLGRLLWDSCIGLISAFGFECYPGLSSLMDNN
jgi:hypothetical protein